MDMHVLMLGIFALATVSAQNVFVATPSMIRLGIEEGVGIAVDGTNENQEFELTIEDHPGRRRKLFNRRSTIRPSNPKIEYIRIEPSEVQDLISPEASAQNFVNLTISGANFHKSVILPVSYRTGYMFVQTDKPIYAPKDRDIEVQLRIIPLNENGKPSTERYRLQIKNPYGNVVKEVELGGKRFTSPEDYIQVVKYTFPEHAIVGIWSATVLHGFKMQQNTTTRFELQKYVLPSFTLKLTTQEVIMPDDENINVVVKAEYVYGKPVDGMVSFRLGVKGEAPDVTYFSALYAKKLVDGMYRATIPTQRLKSHSRIGWFPEIEGSHFVVEATVSDEANGQKEVVTDASSQFSTSPFIISFKRCLKDFRPGLVSVIEADVNYVGGKPAPQIKTKIEAVADGDKPLEITHPISISDDDGKLLFEIHPEMHHSIVNITITTDDPRYPNNQAANHHIQTKFQSEHNAYIAITRTSSKRPRPGKLFTEIIYVEPRSISNIYFMIITRGKILHIEKLKEGNFRVHRLEFRVTQEMVPSFRLLVFAEHEKELIADSLHIEVESMCDPKADVKITTDPEPKIPGSTIKVGIEGSKSTVVGLLAVDSAVYELSETDRLTKSKMFKTLDSHDLGCGPGGGETTQSVLHNAGIVMLTKHYDGIAMVSACTEKVRKKRELISSKLQEHEGFMRECCALGISHDKYNRGCKERAEIVKMRLGWENGNCSDVFLECCLHGEEKGISEMKFTGAKTSQTARMGGSIDEMDFVSTREEEKEEGGVAIRSDFRESWMISQIVLSTDGKEEHEYTLPDSITTWIIQAVSVSYDYGMCVAEPQILRSFKTVFVQLHIPYSVVRNEQIEIRATVFNYGDKSVSAIVYIYGVEGLCTGTQVGEKSERQRLYVAPHSTETAAFPVIPLTEGTHDIRVVALSFSGSDIVIKKLNVIAEGTTVEEHITVMLDPSNRQRRKRRDISNAAYSDSIDESQNLQITTVKLKAPENFIPGTESCTITALGDQFGPTIKTSLQNPDELIDKPRGCAEQAMIYLAPTMYTMLYLKAANKITPELETKGYELIRQGYDLVLTYRKEDGSYGAWQNTPPSTWLTAFIIKVFCQASHLIYVDPNVICSGMKWLIAGQQQDGSFVELNPIYHTEMMGGVKGQTPLTAFVLITLAECDCEIPNMHIIQGRAVGYLEEHLGEINEPLPVAITAYALAHTNNSLLKNAINNKLLALSKYNEGDNTLYWETESSAYDIEATSYGLLTQLMLLKTDKSKQIINWLNTKRLSTGSFKSTQDTVVGLQALSKYAIRNHSPDLKLVSNVTSSNDINILKSFHFDEKNSIVLQEYRIDKLGGTLFVNTAGQGIGFLSVKLRYNVPDSGEQFDKFDVKVNVTIYKEKPKFPEERIRKKDPILLLPSDLARRAKNALDMPPAKVEVAHDLDQRSYQRSRIGRPTGIRRTKREDLMDNSNLVYNVNICTRYLGDHEEGMTIIDVGIFTGFKPDEKELAQLVKNEFLIDTYELSNRGIVFYLRQVPKDEDFCFDFRITREYIVGNTRSAVIKVYLYYDPDESATTLYSPDQNSPLLRKYCSAGVCQCGEGGCPPKRPFAKIGKRKDLKLSACEHHDYVWIVKVLEPVSKKDGSLHIKLLVEEVVKEGIEERLLLEGETRNFLAADSCESAELETDKEYLIMGKDGKKYEDKKGELWHRYVLDKTSKIHAWTYHPPSKNENVMRALHWLKVELAKGCDL